MSDLQEEGSWHLDHDPLHRKLWFWGEGRSVPGHRDGPFLDALQGHPWHLALFCPLFSQDSAWRAVGFDDAPFPLALFFTKD